MIIVACRVVKRRELVLLHLGNHIGRQAHAQFLYEFRITFMREFIFGRQSVESDILKRACTRSVVEGICERCLCRYASPHCFKHVLVAPVGRYAVFIRLIPIFQYVFTHFSQVEIQVTAFGIRIVRIEKRTHHPKLYVLNVGTFKIGIVEFPHYATPAFLWIE